MRPTGGYPYPNNLRMGWSSLKDMLRRTAIQYRLYPAFSPCATVSLFSLGYRQLQQYSNYASDLTNLPDVPSNGFNNVVQSNLIHEPRANSENFDFSRFYREPLVCFPDRVDVGAQTNDVVIPSLSFEVSPNDLGNGPHQPGTSRSTHQPTATPNDVQGNDPINVQMDLWSPRVMHHNLNGLHNVGALTSADEIHTRSGLLEHVNIDSASLKKFRCDFRGCSKDLSRKDRAVAQVLKHLGSRLFICVGACGTNYW